MRTGVFKDPATGAPVALSKLGLGCSKVGSFNNPAPMEQVRRVLAQALDLGVTVFDTADIYGQGDSEREIGRAIRGRRDQAFVVTKFGKLFSAKMRLLAPFKPVLKPVLQSMSAGGQVAAQRDGNMAEDFSPGRYAAALDKSLKRLGLDHVDGILLHSPAAAVVRPGGVVVVKEMGLTPRWKLRWNRFQETLATRVVKITEHTDAGLHFVPPEEMAAWLEAKGLVAEVLRVDRGYPWPHTIVVGRSPA